MTPALDLVAAVDCPLCHTLVPEATGRALLAGADWRCPQCDQLWNAGRLATVAAYGEYCAGRAKA